MKIDEVIREAVTAVFSAPALKGIVVLKGGTALRLSEDLTSRMSLDIDLSAPSAIEDEERFFREMTIALTERFVGFELDVIDERFEKKPKSRKSGQPESWGGWSFSFKLAAAATRKESSRKRIRSALIPEGSSSSKIEIQISENEYCGDTDKIRIDGVEIEVYSPVLLVLEKLRAICQQHPAYRFSTNKNRSRDFYDIFQVVKNHRKNLNFVTGLGIHLEAVFRAKEVPLSILAEGRIFDAGFLRVQELGFPTVVDSVKGKVEDFEYYVEQLKYLVPRIIESRGNPD